VGSTLYMAYEVLKVSAKQNIASDSSPTVYVAAGIGLHFC